MNSKKQKQKLQINIPFGLVVYVPIEIEEYADPEGLETNELGMPIVGDEFDHSELAKKALIVAREKGTIEDYTALLNGAAYLAMDQQEGVTAYVSPFAGLAKYTKVEKVEVV